MRRYRLSRRGMSKESTSTFYMRKVNGHERFQPPRAGNCPETESAVPEISQPSHIDPNESPRAAITYYILSKHVAIALSFDIRYLDDSIGRKFKDVLRIENIADGTS